MTTVEAVRAFCKKNKIPISRLESDLGYGNGFLNPKKISDIPAQRLAEIANYLHVPVETFLGGFEVQEIGIKGETENPPPVGDGLVDKISTLAQSPGLLEELNRFLELAAEDPETARRFLAFAVQELQSSRPLR